MSTRTFLAVSAIALAFAGAGVIAVEYNADLLDARAEVTRLTERVADWQKHAESLDKTAHDLENEAIRLDARVHALQSQCRGLEAKCTAKRDCVYDASKLTEARACFPGVDAP